MLIPHINVNLTRLSLGIQQLTQPVNSTGIDVDPPLVNGHRQATMPRMRSHAMTIAHTKRLALLIALLNGCFSWSLMAAETTVAVASNFTAPMQAIIAEFERLSGHRLRVSFGSSGKFFAQIHNGAPFDAFLSADATKPRALEDQQLAVAGSRFTYAIGTLALWSATDGSDAKQRLQAGNFTRLAIANPRLAPYGAAAMQTLTAMTLGDQVRSKLVLGENISQTYQFVATGNAQLGFVALSQILDKGVIPAGAWVIPADMHQPIRQEAVLLQRGRDNPATQALLQFLRTKEAGDIMINYGYRISE